MCLAVEVSHPITNESSCVRTVSLFLSALIAWQRKVNRLGSQCLKLGSGPTTKHSMGAVNYCESTLGFVVGAAGQQICRALMAHTARQAIDLSLIV